MSNSVFLKPDENGNWGKVGTDAAGSMSDLLTFQSGATATGDGTVQDVSGYATLALNVVISATATVSLEASVDGTNYTAISCFFPTTGSAMPSSLSATARGVRLNISGFKLFRARISSYTSGTVDVTGYLTTANSVQTTSLSTFGSSDTNSITAQLLGVGAYNLLFDGTNWVRQRMATNDATSATGSASASLMGFNGSTWDRVRTVSAGDAIATGILAQGQYVYDATNTNWNRVVSASATSDGYSGTKTPSTALIAFNGTTFDKVRTAGLADGASSTGILANGLFAFNGTSWDKLRNVVSSGDGSGAGMLAQGIYGLNGSTWDRVRVGKVYKYIEFLNLANAAATTVWTPAAGKKFRLMGVSISVSGTNAAVHLRDGAGGTVFHTARAAGTDTKEFSFGNGYLSGLADRVLEIYNLTGSTINVHVTAWGTEE